MSVSLLSPSEFGTVQSMLLYCPELRDRFHSFRERAIRAALGDCSKTPTDNEIKAFIQRLIIANQLAYEVQYAEGDTITVRLPPEELNGNLVSYRELLRILNDIHYNIYTNAGRCFLGKEDEERLEKYEHYLMDALLQR